MLDGDDHFCKNEVEIWATSGEMTGSLFLSPPTLLENSKVDSVYLHPFQCILFSTGTLF